MRKLILEVQISVDGFIGDREGSTKPWLWNWSDEWTWDEPLRKYHEDLIASADVMLLSGRMGEKGGFLAHWSDMAEKKDNRQSRFASDICRTRKLVFSKSLDRVEGENVELVKEDVATKVRALKAESGKNLLVWGGARFVSSLLEADVVDELHLLVNPCALGKGLPIFEKVAKSPFTLSLLSSEGYPCGVVLTKYARRR